MQVAGVTPFQVRDSSYLIQSEQAESNSTKMTEPNKNKPGQGDDGQTGVVTETRVKTKRPSMYRVLLLNDDYTPMEFVIAVLQQIFNKSSDEATTIMLHVHQNGVGVCGVFTYEVAETKVVQVVDAARRAQHPLQCTMEKV